MLNTIATAEQILAVAEATPPRQEGTTAITGTRTVQGAMRAAVVIEEETDIKGHRRTETIATSIRIARIRQPETERAISHQEQAQLLEDNLLCRVLLPRGVPDE